MSGISFTAIDFETANSHRGSACAVGLVKVRDGHIVDTASWLIKPPPGIDDFDPINVELHRITEQDVRNAADWEMSLEGILHFVCEDPLVAFDAAYDASVMRKATEHQHLDLPAKDFYCALHLAQANLPLPQHRLSDVLAALDLPPAEQHEPRTHALACARIVLAIAAQRGLTTLAEVWEQPTTAVGKRRRGRRVRSDADPEAETPGAAGAGESGDALERRGEPGEFGEPDATLKVVMPAETRRAARRAFSTAAGLVLFTLGVAAAVGLAYLTGLTIRFFSAGQTISAALTVAAAAAAIGGIWICITSGWHRLRPGI
jgi:DNA polymerase III epsilon subunit-like protein